MPEPTIEEKYKDVVAILGKMGYHCAPFKGADSCPVYSVCGMCWGCRLARPINNEKFAQAPIGKKYRIALAHLMDLTDNGDYDTNCPPPMVNEECPNLECLDCWDKYITERHQEVGK